MNDNEKIVLVTGARGQLGHDIVKELTNHNIKYIATDSDDLDITDEKIVKDFFKNHSISHVIHSAAYTQVDKAEVEKELNHKINVYGTSNIVNECMKHDIPMVYFSTDYIFGGEGSEPYHVDDKANPLGEYAKSKYEGELLVKKLSKYYIVRISWVFGINGNNFIKTMLKLAETKNELNIVSDQIGSPTYTVDLSKLIIDMIQTDKYGVYHATNEGFVSWADFAREIFKRTNKNVVVHNVTTEEYNAKALRPKNSRLDKSKLVENGFSKLPTWQDALDRFLKELNN
ncbi:MAG: dTDP-4-dehydrorhamnose reductase [Lachnospiraceae bacterium]|nr:dTDP-4-dehydrorhamnose reductase [Lachnospiraceae bacterium]